MLAKVDGIEITEDDVKVALEDLGPTLPQQVQGPQREAYVLDYLIDLKLVARKAGIEYQAPARFDDKLEIGVRCAGFGRSSVRFAIEIYRGEQHLVTGELVYVYADTAVRKGVALPESWRCALAAFEKQLPPVA